MKDETFEAKVVELKKFIDLLPLEQKEQLNKLIEGIKNRNEELRKSFSGIEATLNDLRVNIKYLVFDLEATRRENAELRKLLEGNSNGD